MDALDLQRRWDAQQETYMPDREQRFAVMLDAVEATVGHAPRVLDVAGGTGSISRRVLDRFPAASTVVVDIDAALLAIARATFAADDRARVLSADLATPEWVAALDEPAGSFDAVLTATALHWLTADRVAGTYAEAGRLLRAGGVLINVDHMADPSLRTLAPMLEAYASERSQRRQALDGAETGRSGGSRCEPCRSSPMRSPNATAGSPSATPTTPSSTSPRRGTSTRCAQPASPRPDCCGAHHRTRRSSGCDDLPITSLRDTERRTFPMYEYLTAMAAQEHVRDLRAAADRYRLVAEVRNRARRRNRAASDSPER